MTFQEKQTAFIERYSIIPDPQERLSAIISRKSTLPPLPEEERTEAHLVPGCQSRVWIVAKEREGTAEIRFFAESAMVRGLIGTLCELYDGLSLSEIAEHDPTLFETLGIARNLTPTRLNGLAAVRAFLKHFAVQQLGGSDKAR